jgi:hypothetical protein
MRVGAVAAVTEAISNPGATTPAAAGVYGGLLPAKGTLPECDRVRVAGPVADERTGLAVRDLNTADYDIVLAGGHVFRAVIEELLLARA